MNLSKNKNWLKRAKSKLFYELSLHKEIFIRLLKWYVRIIVFVICLIAGIYLAYVFGFVYIASETETYSFENVLSLIFAFIVALLLNKLIFSIVKRSKKN